MGVNDKVRTELDLHKESNEAGRRTGGGRGMLLKGLTLR